MEPTSHVPPAITHLDEEGAPRMVSVGEKEPTQRTAVAAGRLRMASATARVIRDGAVAKGDVLQIARLAGIMAAKRTADLIPLCHPLALTGVEIALSLADDEPAVIAEATVRAHDRTGVEMEALLSVSTALLTVYDMCKSIDRAMVIEEVRLERKEGGRSGVWIRDTD